MSKEAIVSEMYFFSFPSDALYLLSVAEKLSLNSRTRSPRSELEYSASTERDDVSIEYHQFMSKLTEAGNDTKQRPRGDVGDSVVAGDEGAAKYRIAMLRHRVPTRWCSIPKSSHAAIRWLLSSQAQCDDFPLPVTHIPHAYIVADLCAT